MRQHGPVLEMSKLSQHDTSHARPRPLRFGSFASPLGDGAIATRSAKGGALTKAQSDSSSCRIALALAARRFGSCASPFGDGVGVASSAEGGALTKKDHNVLGSCASLWQLCVAIG